MRCFALIVGLLCLVGISFGSFTNEEARSLFSAFMKEHGKEYSSVGEMEKRFNVFKSNLELLDQFEKSPLYKVGITTFMDLTPDEFHARLMPVQDVAAPAVQNEFTSTATATATATANESKFSTMQSSNHSFHVNDMPDGFDWRGGYNGKFITPVRDQGSAQIGWAIAAAGAIEFAWRVQAGQFFEQLSPQHIIDCANTYVPAWWASPATAACGAQGGSVVAAFEFVEANGIASEINYPLCSGQTMNSCTPCMPKGYNATMCGPEPAMCDDPSNRCDSVGIAAKLSSYMFSKTASGADPEDNIQSYIHGYGPVAVMMDAKWLQFYSSGVWAPTPGMATSCTQTNLNHAMLAVGWDVWTDGTPYWILKNSWGTSWGNDGYLYLKRGVNMCGVATAAALPIVH